MTISTANLPALSHDGNLSRYLAQIHQYPMLEKDEEYQLATAWKDQGDVKAAHKLVTSHMRLVAKIAMGYRGYGLPTADLISEGSVGLMRAVKDFEPKRGFRLSTYAGWWIKASIQEYVLRSWSMVKIGTTAAQKKLFYKLRGLKAKINAAEGITHDDRNLRPEHITQIADQLDVSEKDVSSMEQRLSGRDSSLNQPLSKDGEDGGEWQDFISDERPDHATTFAENDEMSKRQKLMMDSLETLDDRERRIIVARKLKEPHQTLEELSEEFKVSRERVRQIEARAFEKLQAAVCERAMQENLIPGGDADIVDGASS